MNGKEIKVYQPDGQIKMGWLAALGILWAVIMPLVIIGAFVFMNRAGVLNIGETIIPYPAYAILGLTIWQLFATGLTACTNSIIAGGSMVVKINFAKESLVLVIDSLAQFFIGDKRNA